MIALVENRLQELQKLCEEHNVARLELFGSAATENYGEDSDLDFLVEFNEKASERTWFYFDFWDALREMYGRKVDLVPAKRAPENPYFWSSVCESRVVVYES